ncbi:MAG: LemA family protein [Wenzhouxiangellaceae bacterium]|nr:LemA family protein [Wenzhouxiangellaceae bacterium]
MDVLSALAWLLVAALLAWSIWTFNRLVRARNLVRAAFSDIDVQLQRRHDLVPQLVEAVSAYARHEKSVFTETVDLRNRAETADRIEDRERAEAQLAERIDRLVLLAEDYPELKAAENFRQLMTDLVDVEDHLQHARRFYNGAVRALNDRVQQFPDLLIARAAGFRTAPFFDAAVQARGVPRLDLSPVASA